MDRLKELNEKAWKLKLLSIASCISIGLGLQIFIVGKTVFSILDSKLFSSICILVGTIGVIYCFLYAVPVFKEIKALKLKNSDNA